MPLQLNLKQIDGSAGAQLVISEIDYVIENNYSSIDANFTITGEKISEPGEHYGLDYLDYRLYDADGFLIDSGSLILDTNLKPGDKFRDNMTVRGLTLGSIYTLMLTE